MLNNNDFLYKKKSEKNEKDSEKTKKEKELIEYNYNRAEITDFEFTNKKRFKKEMLGLVIFILIFGLIIPFFLFKYDKLEILEAYMPNLDLIANTLGYSKGPYGDLFEDLYNLNKVQISIIAINYFALLGVTFIIATRTLQSKSIIKGWSRAFIMLLATYLVPGNPLSYILYIFGTSIGSVFKVGTFMNWLITTLFGVLVISLIIMFEIFLINNFGGFIKHILRIIVPKFMKKYKL